MAHIHFVGVPNDLRDLVHGWERELERRGHTSTVVGEHGAPAAEAVERPAIESGAAEAAAPEPAPAQG